MASVLVVDDCENILTLLEVGLGKRGHEVFLATCWDEALEVLGEETIDLVLLDVQLGGVDGNVVAGLIRRFTNLRAPILFHSSRSEEELAELVEQTGVRGFVRKGLALSELAERIEAVLQEDAQAPKDD